MNALKLVTIVVPFYNEGDGVDGFYQALRRIFDQVSTVNFQVVCVDDGSSDDTLEKLIGLVDHDPRFVVLELSRNFGKELALTAGIDAADGDAVIPIDADLQDPPELIPQMIEKWLEGAEVVLAKRADRQSDTLLKRVTAKIFYQTHNRLSSLQIPENVGDFRLIDRLVVEAIRKLPERQRFNKGLFAWVGFKSVTIEYVREPRHTGSTKFSGWKLWNFAIEGFTSFSTIPLKVWSYVGFAGALISLAYVIFIISKTLIFGIDVPGYASLLVVVLFIGSLQLISVGILGEYIARIYMETKNRPLYLIRRRYGAAE